MGDASGKYEEDGEGHYKKSHQCEVHRSMVWGILLGAQAQDRDVRQKDLGVLLTNAGDRATLSGQEVCPGR